MKEKIQQLEVLLNETMELIDLQREMEQIDLEEFDRDIESPPVPEIDKNEYKEHMAIFRINIVNYKNNKAFWTYDIPKLQTLLTTTQNRINAYSDLLDIGGSNKPNNDIVQLVEQGIISTKTPISKSHKGKEVSGFLTNDGYLELEINRTKKKYSLRSAALYAWGSNPSNQWKFWEATDNNGIRKPLEEFRKQIK